MLELAHTNQCANISSGKDQTDHISIFSKAFQTDINHLSSLLNTTCWWKQGTLSFGRPGPLTELSVWRWSQAGVWRCVGEKNSSTAHWRIRGGFRCTWSRAKASLPTQSGLFCSHSVADAPPLAALMDAKLCSGDKCRNHLLRPTQAFNHDALLLLLTPQILYRVKSCYSNILRAKRVFGCVKLIGGYFMPILLCLVGSHLEFKWQASCKRIQFMHSRIEVKDTSLEYI